MVLFELQFAQIVVGLLTGLGLGRFQKDWTEEDRASKLGQNHPLDSTKRLNFKRAEDELEMKVIPPMPSKD